MYRAGDIIDLGNGRSVRLNKDTAEIANAVLAEAKRNAVEDPTFLDDVYAADETP